jgi:hypothetical protein
MTISSYSLSLALDFASSTFKLIISSTYYEGDSKK